jgi:hypothetical protein
MKIESSAEPNASTLELGRGRHGVVEYDRESNLVCKRLIMSETEDAGQFAQREFDHLKRLSLALLPHSKVSCPSPVSIDRKNAAVWMTYCPGERVDQFLDRAEETGTHLDNIGRQTAVALRAFIEEFKEPWFSLSAHNMIYEAETGVLSVFDFTKPRSFDAISSKDYPYEISLGCYLAATTRFTVSPVRWAKREFWNRQCHLSTAIVKNVSEDQKLNGAIVEQVNSSEYRRLGLKDKRLSRRLWYSTAGWTLFHRRSRDIITRTFPQMNLR